MYQPILTYHPEVEKALKTKKPVVALESTLITHGLPHPINQEVALAIEASVRESGAVPATIAILNGQVMVGLTAEQVTYLAQADEVYKCSTRDLPLVMARRGDGATTVAATCVIAHRAGIPIFATGGIGGVHVNSHWDVSADLSELGRTPMTVICAGVKSFLDRAATLEMLETLAVPVLGYQTGHFPAFYSHPEDLPVNQRVDTPQEVARIIQARDAFALRHAILLTVPVPPDEEWPIQQAQPLIEKALTEAESKNVAGNDITPYLLDRLDQLSQGRSKAANVALLLNNARVAGQVAVVLSNLY